MDRSSAKQLSKSIAAFQRRTLELNREVNMDTYRIPLVWQMYGHCDVDANSLVDAIEIALGPDTPLPDGCYVEDSVGVDYEVLELDQETTT